MRREGKRRDGKRGNDRRGSNNYRRDRDGDNRDNNKFGNFNRGNFGFNSQRPRRSEMHKAICSDCGKECEVPFKPTEGKPVYCRACFAKHRKPSF